MDFKEFFSDFQDYLAPKLDTYEQAIYLYIFRHTRLKDQDEATIGFKSARTRMALGIGKAGSPMAEYRCRQKLQSLERKGCIEILDVERAGTRIRLKLPREISGIVPSPRDSSPISIEEMDFFEVLENRRLILEREGHKCFYCLRSLNSENYVIEHVTSRPDGKNTYRNVVAACRQCNNRKATYESEDFLRTLYRDGFLNSSEFEDRLSHLEQLREGKLVPKVVPS